MAFFEYKAMDGKGKSTEGVIESESTVTAINKIREMGYYPTSVTERKKKAAGTAAQAASAGNLFSFFTRKKVGAKEYVAFMRQFATLVDAGLPILRSLRTLEEQQTNLFFKKVLGDVSNSVESGNNLSDSMRRFPAIFSDLFINMVKAGEAGGVLDQVLLRMAVFYEKSAKLRSKVKASLAYPSFVVIIAGGIVYFLLSFVIPRFKTMFEDMNVELPMITQSLLSVSDFMKNNMILMLGGGVGLFVIIKILLTIPRGKRVRDRLILYLPLFGPLAKKVAISRFSRTLGTLINSGVPILDALDITAKTVGNTTVAENVGLVHANIKEGESMVAPLRQGKIFPPVVISMISVGEETGKISDMLLKVADTYDDEVDTTIAAMTGLIEPAIIVSLALVVGFIVIAMFMPLIAAIEQMSTAGG